VSGRKFWFINMLACIQLFKNTSRIIPAFFASSHESCVTARSACLKTARIFFSCVHYRLMYWIVFISASSTSADRLCGLGVRVRGYRSGGPGSIPGTTRKKKVVGLERGTLSLVSTTEELLVRKVAAPV
jgi:hypothetical protein